VEVAKQASSFPESSNVSTADEGHTIARLFSSVEPSILLRHSHHVLNSHVFGGSKGSQLRNFKASGAQTLVDSLREEDVDSIRNDLLKDGEKDRDHLVGKERRPVVSGSVDPAEQKVVVTIGESFSLVEEFLGSGLVKFSAHFVA